jgi:adenylate kinase
MNVILEEAREAYAEEIVIALQSESTDDLESNVSRIVQWIEAWQQNQKLNLGT